MPKNKKRKNDFATPSPGRNYGNNSTSMATVPVEWLIENNLEPLALFRTSSTFPAAPHTLFGGAEFKTIRDEVLKASKAQKAYAPDKEKWIVVANSVIYHFKSPSGEAVATALGLKGEGKTKFISGYSPYVGGGLNTPAAGSTDTPGAAPGPSKPGRGTPSESDKGLAKDLFGAGDPATPNVQPPGSPVAATTPDGKHDDFDGSVMTGKDGEISAETVFDQYFDVFKSGGWGEGDGEMLRKLVGLHSNQWEHFSQSKSKTDKESFEKMTRRMADDVRQPVERTVDPEPEHYHPDGAAMSGPAGMAQAQPFARIQGTGGDGGPTPYVTQGDHKRSNADMGGAMGGTGAMSETLGKGGDSTMEQMGMATTEAEATLRPQFPLDPLANQVVPTADKQIASDVLFDMFSVVQPGFGQGTDNKLVYENQSRENSVRFKDPMFLPRFEHGNADIGAAQHIHPLPWQFQPNGNASQIISHLHRLENKMSKMKRMIKTASVGVDTKTLPGTMNTYSSSKGLPRKNKNMLEPVINNRQPWQPVADPAGKDLKKRGFRQMHSVWSNPFQPELDPMNSGPTLSKRRALDVILQ